MEEIKLIVGLGNPGPKYELTRHNIAWLVLDELAAKESFDFDKEKFKSQVGEFIQTGDKKLVIKPQTFMNLSGEAVQSAVHFYKLEPKNILVIHDELDLELGRIMLKKGGGLAGHNGLKSIAQSLSSQEFYRLRVGISKPPRGWKGDWVLGQFTSEETQILEKVLQQSAAAISFFIGNGFTKTAAEFNQKT